MRQQGPLQLGQGEQASINGVFQIGDAVTDIVGGLHQVDQRKARPTRQPQRIPQLAHQMTLAKEVAQLLAHPRRLLTGLRLQLHDAHRHLDERCQQAVGEIEPLQGVHQPQALGITIEGQQIGQQAALPLRTRRPANTAGIEARQLGGQPVTQHRLTKVTKGGIAHIMEQTGHLQQIEQGHLGHPLQTGQQGQHQLTAGLLHLQRVGQPAAHRGLHIQRKDLGLLLQATNRRTLHHPGPIPLRGFEETLAAHRLETQRLQQAGIVHGM